MQQWVTLFYQFHGSSNTKWGAHSDWPPTHNKLQMPEVQQKQERGTWPQAGMFFAMMSSEGWRQAAEG